MSDIILVNEVQDPLFLNTTDVSVLYSKNGNGTYEIEHAEQSSSSVNHLSYVKITTTPNTNATYCTSKFKCNFVSGHKYYVSIDLKSNTEDNTGYNLHFPNNPPHTNIGTVGSRGVLEKIQPTLVANVWMRASMIVQDASCPSGQYSFRFDNTANTSATGNNEICFSNCIVIDLTESWGEGNEPILSWLNTNILLDADGTPKIKTEVSDFSYGVNGFNHINFVMKQRSKKVLTKIQYLDKTERVLGEIHGRCINGSINIANSEMVRRTLSMDFLANDKLEISPNSPFWADKRIRVYTGIESFNGTVYWYNQGIYIPTKPQTNVSLSGRTITIEASDKFKLADSFMPYDLEYKVNTPISTAILDLMAYADISDKIIVNNNDYVLPYDYTAPAGDNIIDKVQEIQNLYADFECYYDLEGNLVLQNAKNCYNDVPIWSFKDDYDFTINRTISTDYDKIYNQFYIFGYFNPAEKDSNGNVIKDAHQPKCLLELPPEHPFSKESIGRTHRMVEQNDSWTKDEQCEKRAEYYREKMDNLINEFSIVCAPIYTLNEVNKVIKVTDNGNEYTCLVDNITYPLGIGDSMTIGCHEIFESNEVN